jgi:phosphoenolpyruvate synthase/pyruvate phosphate dikinase
MKPHLNGVGGKAASLVWLTEAGFSVPAFAVVPAELWFPESWATSAETSRLRFHCERLESAGDDFAVATRSAMLRQMIEEIGLPAEASTIVGRWATNAQGPLFTFVRSSAATEDQPSSSSAGQYESYLVPTAYSELASAVIRVVQSYYGDRAVRYRRSMKLSQLGPRMSVVLQRAISPSASGVAFGCDPTTGARGVITVESCFGFGTAIVSGAVTPDHFVVEKETLRVITSSVGTKRIADMLDSSGSLKRHAVDGSMRGQFSIGADVLREVAEKYMQIEILAGYPQDVEWAVEGNHLWILQSRPVTSLPT